MAAPDADDGGDDGDDGGDDGDDDDGRETSFMFHPFRSWLKCTFAT